LCEGKFPGALQGLREILFIAGRASTIGCNPEPYYCKSNKIRKKPDKCVKEGIISTVDPYEGGK